MRGAAFVSRQDPSGFSLVELVFTLGLASLMTAIAAASIAGRLDEIHAAGAARHLAALFQRTRTEAITRNAHIGVKVSVTPTTDVLVSYLDGDNDGVLSADIQDGTDRAVGNSERLADLFPGVRFGALAGVPAVDSSAPPPGGDPIRLGVSDMAVFTPLGTATSGTLYVLGRGRQQFAVRVFGETGRTRLFRFNVARGQWQPL